MLCVTEAECVHMAGLRWMVVALTFVLSAGGGSAAVDQNWLTSIIDGIKKE